MKFTKMTLKDYIRLHCKGHANQYNSKRIRGALFCKTRELIDQLKPANQNAEGLQQLALEFAEEEYPHMKFRNQFKERNKCSDS